MIMFILIAIALGVSLIIVSQMKMMKGMGDSVVALYAADTGIENALYQHRKQGSIDPIPNTPLGEASYTATYEENPLTGESKWKSSGSYGGVKRAIEITHPAVFDFSISVVDESTNMNYAWWCSNPIHIPGVISVTTTHLTGINPPINFTYTPEVPGISVIFTPAGCGSTDCYATLNITGIPNDGNDYTITVHGKTTIKTKDAPFTVCYDTIGTCNCF
jgi:hypothetical protein